MIVVKRDERHDVNKLPLEKLVFEPPLIEDVPFAILDDEENL
jgi:hypothetical protein